MRTGVRAFVHSLQTRATAQAATLIYGGIASDRRFIAEDPIGLDGGPNVYAYVLNNPLSYNDPMGMDNPSGGDQPKPPPEADRLQNLIQSCIKLKIPTDPGQQTGDQCFAKAKEGAQTCDAKYTGRSILGNALCSQCWSYYASQCPLD